MKTSTIRFPLICSALAALLAVGCGGDSTSSSSAAGGSQDDESGKTAKPKPKPSARKSLASFRPLLDETGRAELEIAGPVVDFGGSDQHKYTRGGWRGGWGESSHGDDGVGSAAVNGKSASFALVTREPVLGISLRGRSPIAGQVVRVLIDGKGYGNGELGAAWTEVAMTGDPIAPGRHQVTLLFDKPSPKGPRAELDWAWLRTAAEAPAPVLVPRVLPVKLGGSVRRALPTPTPRTYSFYLQVPAKASLLVDYGSPAATTFSVWADVDGAEPAELFSAQATPNEWTEAKIDLGAYAGKAMRLRFETSGENGPGGWGEPEIMLPPDALAPKLKAGAPPKNVVFILIDTVRADAYEAFAPGNQIKTPAFDALATKSLVFRAAYDNENWTKPSVATTLTGMYPSTHDTKTDPAVLPDAIEILPQLLKKAGFATAGFVANGFISEKYGFEKGWDTFTNYIRENKKSDAEYVYADALAWIKEQEAADKPYFAYIQTIDPHVVYKVDREYSKLYYEGDYKGSVGPVLSGQKQADISQGKIKISEDDYDWIRALYWGEVTYHDEHMGLFLAELEKLGVTEDTLIVVTNDHGEELNEHGRLGHGHSLYQEMIQAPLLMHYPPMIEPGFVDEVVEHVDLTPTLLELLQLEPRKDADGQSLLPLLQGRAVPRPYYAISEFLDNKRAIRVGDWRLIVSGGSAMDLFDVVNEPDETDSRHEQALVALRMTEVYLGEGLAAPDKSQRRAEQATRRQFEAGTVKMDPELKKQLEALGYFGE